MPSRTQVRQLLDRGHSYESAAAALDIPAGLAFMIATGRPADGADATTPEHDPGPRLTSGSAQQLVNPPAVNPVRSPTVIDWVRARATRELTRPR